MCIKIENMSPLYTILLDVLRFYQVFFTVRLVHKLLQRLSQDDLDIDRRVNI
mgnify:CR=1 FL=1